VTVGWRSLPVSFFDRTTYFFHALVKILIPENRTSTERKITASDIPRNVYK